MTNKRNISICLMLIVLLFQACQESPTQIKTADNSTAITQQSGPNGVQGELEDPEGLIDDDVDPCLEDPNDPFNVILDCEGPGGGDPGSGPGSTSEWDEYVYVHKGKTNNNLYYAESENGTSWSTGQIPLGAKTSDGPATVFFQNQLFVYYKGNSSNNIFYSYKPSPGGDWDGNEFINTHSKTNREITATVHNGKVFIAHVGESQDALYLATSDDGMDFDTQVEILPDHSGVDEFAMFSHNNRLYIIHAVNFPHDEVPSFSVRIRWSDNPTDPDSWDIPQNRVTLVLNGDSPSRFESYNGIDAVSHNGEIHLTWAFGYRESRWYPENRSLWWGKLDSDHNLDDQKSLNQTTKRRPSITSGIDGNLIISFASDRGDELVKTLVVDTDGMVLNSTNSGGATKKEGVHLTNRSGQ